MRSNLKHILIGLLALNFVVIVHESGHFVACKLFGVRVDTFSIGFPPVIASTKIGHTTFQLGALPLGGFVSPDHKEVQQLPYLKKMIMVLAGVFFNFLLAFLLFFILARRTTRETVPSPTHGQTITHTRKSFTELFRRMGPTIAALVKRNGDITGPIGIMALMGKSLSFGFDTFLYFMGIISLNLGFFNLLPLPMLDGGQATRYTIEALVGSRLPAGIINLLYIIFMAFLIALLMRLTFRDIRHLRQK